MSPWRKLAFAALAALLGAGSAGCSSCEERAAGTDAGAEVELAPVPAPAGLAAELFVSKPEATWRALRELLGPPAAVLPGSFALLVATSFGLGPEAASAIDGDATLVAALSRSGSELQPVVTVRARSGGSLRAALTAGQSGAFSAERDPKSGLWLLSAKPGKTGRDDAVLAIAGEYLLAARDRAALVATGPYVATTLAKRSPPAEPIVLRAEAAMLRGPLAAAIREGWRAKESLLRDTLRREREERGGRAPDFADPEAMLSALSGAVGSFAAFVESLKEAQLVVTPGSQRLDLELSVVALPRGAAREFLRESPRGDLAPMLRLPAGSGAALLARSTPAARAESARDLAESIGGLFGERLAKSERERLGAALLALAAGRGDEARFAFAPSGIVARIAVADRAILERGLRGAIDSLRFRAIREPVESLLGPFSVRQSSARVAGFEAPVGRAVFGRAGAAPPASASPFELVWTFHGDSLLLALGAAGERGLGDLMRSNAGEAALAETTGLSEAAGRVGRDVSFGALLDLGAFGAFTDARPGQRYVMVAGGGAGDRGVLRAEASKGAVETALGLAIRP